ncbi:MAG: SET domain-containing protein [Patescibacteria group bacterium]
MKSIFVGESLISGSGIMAGEDIKKGEFIGYIRGKLKFLKVTNKKQSLSFPNWVGISKGVWIDPPYPYQFLNHSCEPTAGIKRKISMVAIRDIKKGQEITIDYSIIEGDKLWEMKCSCGEKNCRGIIRSIQYLPKRNFNKYMPYIPKYFQRLFLSSRRNK